MPHPLAADAAVRDLHAAAVADHPFVLHAAVLAARAFPVLLRAENPLAEQSVALGTIGAVVDCLGLFDLAEGPLADVVGAGKPDLYRAVIVNSLVSRFGAAHVTLSFQETWCVGGEIYGDRVGRRRIALLRVLFQLNIQAQAADLVAKHVEAGG